MALTKVTSGLISADASSVDLNIDAGTLYIDSTNNRVGIGTTSPSRLLETVATNAGADITALQVRNNDSSTSTSTSIRFVNSTSGTSTAGGSEITSIRNSNDGGSLVFKTATDSTASLGERARIDSSGNVGIGTTSPADTYSYGKALDIQSSTGGAVYMRDTADTSKFGFTSFDGTTDRLNVGTGGTGTYLRFITVGDERMRIDSSGNLLVGTTTAYGLLAVDAGSGFSSSGVIARFLGTSGNSLLIRGDGDAENTNGNYSAISDEKLKQDITDAGSQWDDIKNLRVRNYKLKSHVETYGDDAPIYIGVIAQEAELVTPNLVKNNPDLDEEQNDLGTVTKSFKYSILYMKAVKALQEAMTRIEDLEARITALENT